MTLNTREKYIAIGVGVAILLYVSDSVFFTPMLDQLSTADKLVDDHQLELQKDQGTMDNSLTARRKWKSLTVNHLPTDASTAEGALLSRVRDAAEQAGLSLGQQNRSQHEKQGGFETITRRFTGEGNMSKLSRFMYELDRSDIPIRVVDLAITSKKDGTDDLSLQLGIATIFDPPVPPKVASAGMRFGGVE